MTHEKNLVIGFIISAALILASVSTFAEPTQILNSTNDKDAVQKSQFWIEFEHSFCSKFKHAFGNESLIAIYNAYP